MLEQLGVKKESKQSMLHRINKWDITLRSTEAIIHLEKKEVNQGVTYNKNATIYKT